MSDDAPPLQLQGCSGLEFNKQQTDYFFKEFLKFNF